MNTSTIHFTVTDRNLESPVYSATLKLSIVPFWWVLRLTDSWLLKLRLRWISLTGFFQDQFEETWVTFGTSYHDQHRQRWGKEVFQYQDNSRSFVVLQANNQESIYIVDWNLLEYRYVHNHLVDCWNQYCKQHLMFLERQTWSRLRIGFELKLSKLNEPAFGYNNNF